MQAVEPPSFMRSAETQAGNESHGLGSTRSSPRPAPCRTLIPFLKDRTIESRDNSLTNCPRDECTLTD